MGIDIAVGRRRRLMLLCIFSVCLLSPLSVVKRVSHKIATTAKSLRSSALAGVFNWSGFASLILLSSLLKSVV